MKLSRNAARRFFQWPFVVNFLFSICCQRIERTLGSSRPPLVFSFFFLVKCRPKSTLINTSARSLASYIFPSPYFYYKAMAMRALKLCNTHFVRFFFLLLTIWGQRGRRWLRGKEKNKIFKPRTNALVVFCSSFLIWFSFFFSVVSFSKKRGEGDTSCGEPNQHRRRWLSSLDNNNEEDAGGRDRKKGH